MFSQSRPRLRPVRRDYFAGRFLLIPADSRPVSILTPRLVARLADHDILLPPVDLLGDVNQHGNPEQLIEWVRRFDFDEIEGVIVSIEMLARGGSKGASTSEATLRQRLAILDFMRGDPARLPIYGFVAESDKTAGIALDLLAADKLDHLLVCRDQLATSEGDATDRSILTNQIAQRGLAGRTTVTSGVDAAAQLLISRLLNRRFGISPTVWVGTSPSPQAAGLGPLLLSQVGAFDGRTLPGTPDAAARADIVLFVNAPETEAEGRAALLETIAVAISKGYRVAVADQAQSAADRQAFFSEIRRRKMLDQLVAYTAAAPGELATGSALAQATSRLMTMRFLRDDIDRLQRVERAQVELGLSRVLTEILYADVIRPKLEVFVRDQLKADSRRLGLARERAEEFARSEVTRLAEEIFREQYFRNMHSILLATGERAVFELRALQRIQLRLAWGTATEVELRAGVFLPLSNIVQPESQSGVFWELMDVASLDPRIVRRFDSINWPSFRVDVEDISLHINFTRKDVGADAFTIQSRRKSKTSRKIEVASGSAKGAAYGLSRLEQLGIEGSLSEDLSINDKPVFSQRGIIERIDGLPWSHRDRIDVIRFLGKVRMNRYYLTHKGGTSEGERWRDRDSDRDLDRIKELVTVCHENFVTLVVGIGPARSIRYGSEEDFQLLIGKINSLSRSGVHHFQLLFDDAPKTLQNADDRSQFKSLAGAQAHLLNRVYGTLQRTGQSFELSMLPSVVGDAGEQGTYLRELTATLVPDIGIAWPPASREAGATQTQHLKDFAERRLIVLDDFASNEGATWRPFLGPKTGSFADVGDAASGIIAFAPSQPHASMLSLASFAEFAWDPKQFDSRRAHQRAFNLLFDKRSAAAMQLWSESFRDNRWHSHPFEAVFQKQAGEIDVAGIDSTVRRLSEALEALALERETGLMRGELALLLSRVRAGLRRLHSDPSYERLPNDRLRLRRN